MKVLSSSFLLFVGAPRLGFEPKYAASNCKVNNLTALPDSSHLGT